MRADRLNLFDFNLIFYKNLRYTCRNILVTATPDAIAAAIMKAFNLKSQLESVPPTVARNSDSASAALEYFQFGFANAANRTQLPKKETVRENDE